MSGTSNKYINIINLYLEKLKSSNDGNLQPELEVKFATIGNININKTDFDNVAKKLTSCGFNIVNKNNYLNIKLSSDSNDDYYQDLRIQLLNENIILDYCSKNNLFDIYDNDNVIFNNKYYDSKKDRKDLKVDNKDFNFRITLQNEENLSKENKRIKLLKNLFQDKKKTFRLINRNTFKNDDFPFNIDLSIVRQSKKSKTRNNKYVSTYTLQESNVFNNEFGYEIEIEFDNNTIKENNYEAEYLHNKLKSVIKFIVAGIQETNYPITFDNQMSIINEYFDIIKDDKSRKLKINSRHFIGPSSTTLQLENIIDNEDTNIPNILDKYTITDKADGLRKLLFINEEGKLYLINTQLKIQFTGTRIEEENYYNTIADGEHILHDKEGNFVDMYALFDLYFINKKDIRSEPFVRMDDSKRKIFRLNTLKEMVKDIKLISNTKNNKFNIFVKTFYTINNNLFKSSSNILKRQKIFPYNTDGVIFTPAEMSVGSNKLDVPAKPLKLTWKYSFKWKPPEFNTIDFLIKVIKDDNNEDIVGNEFVDGNNLTSNKNILQYKTLNLYVGFDENKHGYINPCMNIIDDNVNFSSENDYNNNYKPALFMPTFPSSANAYICNVYLENNLSSLNNGNMLTEEGEIIEDNTIVEFRYDNSRKSNFKWIPLKVRYDKTAELRNPNSVSKNYGNDYDTANSNWKSIHNPITEDMITTGKNIPKKLEDENVYYNKVTGSTNTTYLRQFHNLYVKKKLIDIVSNKNDILIDYSVGKGGDLPKWINSDLKFVLGIDLSKDNIENRIDGACARYLNQKKKNNNIPDVLFLHGDSTKNIKELETVFTERNKKSLSAVFGKGEKDIDILGKGIFKKWNIASNDFNISSIQFAIHYMFENTNTLHNFLRNVSECTRVNGYFIGTSYDGKKVFDLLKKTKPNDSITYFENEERIWQITKKYKKNKFNDDESCIGYPINVFQDSINQTQTEYLVNYEYLTKILEYYGFKLLNKDKLKDIGLSKSYDSFEKLFVKMNNEVKKNRELKKSIKDSLEMTNNEKKISFLNNYFIFKKVRNVDAENVCEKFINNNIDDIKSELEKSLNKTYISKPRKLRNRIKLK